MTSIVEEEAVWLRQPRSGGAPDQDRWDPAPDGEGEVGRRLGDSAMRPRRRPLPVIAPPNFSPWVGEGAANVDAEPQHRSAPQVRPQHVGVVQQVGGRR
jgi:hypothetical protein